MQPLIVGAGLAGLIAACHFRNSPIIEAGKPQESHKALLRFRTPAVSELTGIPFKEVRVHKEVVMDDRHFVGTCPIRAANMYAMKVTGAVASRSIMNLATVTRWVAPDDFYQQLLNKVGDRIAYEESLSSGHLDGFPVISTAPMHVNMDACKLEIERGRFGFERAPIIVNRYRLLVDSEVYQTVYFADRDTSLFRASITGNVLIIESLEDHSGKFMWTEHDPYHLDEVLEAFGLRRSDIDISSRVTVDQRYGKIVDMDGAQRRAVLHAMTAKYNLYSLGRFATWRNILLDDVVSDIQSIDRLINANEYTRSLMRVSK